MAVTLSLARSLAVLAFAAVLAGSFLPWAHVGPYELAGTDRSGTVTAVLALVGMYLVLTCRSPAPLKIAAVAASLTAAIGLYETLNLAAMGNQIRMREMAYLIGQPSLGIGLQLVLIGGLTALLSCLSEAQAQVKPKRHRPALRTDRLQLH